MEPTADHIVIVLMVCLVLKTLENVKEVNAIRNGMVSTVKVNVTKYWISVYTHMKDIRQVVPRVDT